jgi:hypothetical protein
MSQTSPSTPSSWNSTSAPRRDATWRASSATRTPAVGVAERRHLGRTELRDEEGDTGSGGRGRGGLRGPAASRQDDRSRRPPRREPAARAADERDEEEARGERAEDPPSVLTA